MSQYSNDFEKKNYVKRGVFILCQNITVLQVLRGGGSGQYITVYYRGGEGSRKGPKKYYVIFAQPLTSISNFV